MLASPQCGLKCLPLRALVSCCSVCDDFKVQKCTARWCTSIISCHASHIGRCAQVTRYLGYSSLKDFFPTMDIRPNPGCANALCARRQAEAEAAAASPEARRIFC